jgi:peptidyl-prolyl cis-trans isomerase SurA
VSDTDTVTVRDFERAYIRMRIVPPAGRAEKEDFLGRLVDYTVKLREAEAAGYASEPEVADDIAQHRDDLAISWLLERRVYDPGIEVLYRRRMEQVRASHILVKFHRDAGGRVDSASTRAEAEELLRKVRASGELFDTLVVHYSEDAGKEKSRGDLDWFIAGVSLPELDDIVYTLQVGEISPVLLKSHFGYHIVKLTGRAPARLRVRASQILYRLDPKNPTDTAAGYARLSLILDSLQRGLAAFEDLARRNSQDPVSGEAGGDLGWVERGTNLEPRFEEALFNLPKGQTSPVVRSAFGMHIIRVTDETAARPLEEQREVLKPIYHKERFANDYRQFVKDLRAAHEYRPSPDVYRVLASRMDSGWTTSTPDWRRRLTERDNAAYFFRIRGRAYTVREAAETIARDPVLQMRPFTVQQLDTIAMYIADRLILVEETRGFETRYPEFADLARDYRASAIISRLDQQHVLDRLAPSEGEIRSWWEQHRDSYRWPDRVLFSEIYSYSEQQAKRMLDSLRAGVPFGDLAARNTKRTGMFQRQGSWGWVPVHRNELSRTASQMTVGQLSGVIRMEDGFSVIRMDGRDSTREKTFEEARSEAAADLRQQMTERAMAEYARALREKYHVVTFEDNLDATFRPGWNAAGKEGTP